MTKQSGSKDIKDMTPIEAAEHREQEARDRRRDNWSDHVRTMLQDLGADKNGAGMVSLHITFMTGFQYPKDDAKGLRKRIRELEEMTDAAVALNNAMAEMPVEVQGELQTIYNLAALADRPYIPADARDIPEKADELRAGIQAAKTVDELGMAIKQAEPLRHVASFYAPAPADAIRNLAYSIKLLRDRYAATRDTIQKTPGARRAVRDLLIRNIVDLIWQVCPSIGDWDSVDVICEIITLAFNANDIPVPASGDTTRSGEEAQGRLRRMVKEYLQTKHA